MKPTLQATWSFQVLFPNSFLQCVKCSFRLCNAVAMCLPSHWGRQVSAAEQGVGRWGVRSKAKRSATPIRHISRSLATRGSIKRIPYRITVPSITTCWGSQIGAWKKTPKTFCWIFPHISLSQSPFKTLSFYLCLAATERLTSDHRWQRGVKLPQSKAMFYRIGCSVFTAPPNISPLGWRCDIWMTPSGRHSVVFAECWRCDSL